MLKLNDNTIIALCQKIDAIEADLRGLENRLRQLRLSFREALPMQDRDRCGYVPVYTDVASPAAPQEQK